MFKRYRRVVAFVIDMFIVSILAIFISSNLTYNPYAYDTEDLYKEFESMNPTIEDFEKSDEYFRDLGDKAYALEKSQIYMYGWYLLFYFLYFVIFAYFTEGQTLGKKMTHQKIVKKDDSRVGIINLILRMLTNGSSLFMGANLLIISKVLGILIFDAGTTYVIFYIFTSFIAFIVEIANIFMFSFSKDNMCLNDKISKSKVIILN